MEKKLYIAPNTRRVSMTSKARFLQTSIVDVDDNGTSGNGDGGSDYAKPNIFFESDFAGDEE